MISVYLLPKMSEYTKMEEVLKNKVVKPFISLSKEDRKIRTIFLEEVIQIIVLKLREVDKLFNAMYQRIFYGGSYYDDLNVGVPQDYDLDLLLKLPVYADPVLTTSNLPGMVNLEIQQPERWLKQPGVSENYRNFDKIYDNDKYLNTEKVLKWFHSILQLALNKFPQDGTRAKIQKGSNVYLVAYKKTGPAYTLLVKCPGLKDELNVDLVPCFVFGGNQWPKDGFKPKFKELDEFFIVAKKPKSKNEISHVERYWRLSFQAQERILLTKRGNRIKDTIKLMKKLRTTQGHHAIASYYLKTIVLLIADQKEDSFWNLPLSHTFMTVLKQYKSDFMDKKTIQYYWSKNKNHNLIGFVGDQTLNNFGRRIAVIIDKIENNYKTNPSVILDYLLTKEERMQVLSI